MTRRLAALLLPGAVVVGGCGAAGGATAPAASSAGTSSAWVEPDDYTFAVTSSCGERSFLGDHRVVVAGGAVVAADRRDPGDGQWSPVDPGQLEWVPTLGDMLAEAEAASDDPEAGEVVVETAPADGHPTEISVDAIAAAIDDESCFLITDYRPGG